MFAVLLCIDILYFIVMIVKSNTLGSQFIPVVYIRVKSVFWRGVTPGFL